MLVQSTLRPPIFCGYNVRDELLCYTCRLPVVCLPAKCGQASTKLDPPPSPPKSPEFCGQCHLVPYWKCDAMSPTR